MKNIPINLKHKKNIVILKKMLNMFIRIQIKLCKQHNKDRSRIKPTITILAFDLAELLVGNQKE